MNCVNDGPETANPAGEAQNGVLRLDFDRRVMVQFRGSVVTSDAGLLAYRELDDALGLSETAGNALVDARTGMNGRHALVGLLRQSVFGRLAGYEDVNDAERLRDDPAMRWIVGGKAAQGRAASPSQMKEPRRHAAFEFDAIDGHGLIARPLPAGRRVFGLHKTLSGFHANFRSPKIEFAMRSRRTPTRNQIGT
jgi:hypothetical protein